MTIELTYICMVPVKTKGRKTKVWEVLTKDDSEKGVGGEDLLGEVRWFGRWRGYAFFPSSNTVYEHKCLREIADFIQGQTREHMALKRKPKKVTGRVKLTDPQLDELRAMAVKPQSTYGSSRTRVQNNLVAKGLAQYVNEEGKPMGGPDATYLANRCAITAAGRAKLKELRST